MAEKQTCMHDAFSVSVQCGLYSPPPLCRAPPQVEVCLVAPMQASMNALHQQTRQHAGDILSSELRSS